MEMHLDQELDNLLYIQHSMTLFYTFFFVNITPRL